MDNFLIIAITRPDFYAGEAERINTIIANGLADIVHIRKPGSDINETASLLEKINPYFFKKLKLHEHFSLLNKYPLRGVHLNSRNPLPYPYGYTSKSLHSLQEIDDEKTDELEYFFISPVFDSISKSNYKSNFDLDDLSLHIQNKKAIALGGVTPDKFSFLKEKGFKGAAMLGYFFP